MPSLTSTFDANDRLNADNYDANGNTTGSSSNSYAYDFENRLTSLNNGAVSYVYDGDGNRVSKTVSGVTTNYLVDTNNHTGYAQVVEELQNGSVVKQFTYGHDLISQRTVGGPLSFYSYDGHGSVRQLTDATGVITDTYNYDAFGILIHHTGTTPNDYLYAGEQFDPHLGFQYLRARYLNPSNGRFISLDTFEGDSLDPLTLHKYLYAGADPVNKTDPSGMFFSLAEASIATQIQTTLVNIQSAVGFRVIDALSDAMGDSEIDIVSVWDLLNFAPLAGPILGAAVSKLTPVLSSGKRGHVSGFREILKKARVAAAGDEAIGAEIRAAKAFRDKGLNVHFQTAAGDLGIQNVRSSDLLIGGQRGTGIGGVRYEVYSPETDILKNIASNMREKLSQSDHLILDLSRTSLSPADFDNIIHRVSHMGGVLASNLERSRFLARRRDNRKSSLRTVRS